MTSRWVPSTEQVRSHYVFNQTNQWDAERGEAFDRWLAAHDAEVRAGVVTAEPEWEYVRGWIAADGRARISQGVIAPSYVADFIAEGGEVVRRRVSKFETVTADMVPAEQEGASTDA